MDLQNFTCQYFIGFWTKNVVKAVVTVISAHIACAFSLYKYYLCISLLDMSYLRVGIDSRARNILVRSIFHR